MRCFAAGQRPRDSAGGQSRGLQQNKHHGCVWSCPTGSRSAWHGSHKLHRRRRSAIFEAGTHLRSMVCRGFQPTAMNGQWGEGGAKGVCSTHPTSPPPKGRQPGKDLYEA